VAGQVSLLMSSCHCFQLSLFFDVLLALCVGMTEEWFIERGLLSAGGDSSDNTLMCSARRLVWRQMKGFCMKAGLFSFCLCTHTVSIYCYRLFWIFVNIGRQHGITSLLLLLASGL